MVSPERETGDVTTFQVAHDHPNKGQVFQLLATKSQSAMWRFAQLGAQQNCSFNETFCISLLGVVDEEILLKALQCLPIIHPVIGGRFSAVGTTLLIPDNCKLNIIQLDLAHLNEQQRQLQCEAEAYRQSHQPFDLATGPLFRASLLKLNVADFQLFISVHHIVCDGWSLDVLLDDLGKIYTAMLGEGRFPNPSRLGVEAFVDHINSDLYAKKKQKSAEYWKDNLKTIPNKPFLSEEEITQQHKQTFDFANYVIKGESLALIKRFAKAQGLSLFALMFAGFAIQLQRKLKLQALAICIPVARHIDAEMENSVGNFVSMLPVTCFFNEEQTFLDLCNHVHQQLLDSREHAALDLDEIIDILGVESEQDKAAFKLARFVPVHKYTPEELRFGNAKVDYRGIPRAFDTYQISLSMLQGGDDISLYVTGDPLSFNQQYLVKCLRELETIMLYGSVSPMTLLQDLELSNESKEKILAAKTSLPKTDIEVKLKSMFSSVLGHADLSVESDFFHLGGTSKLAEKLVESVNRVFDVRLTLQDLQAQPSVKHFAQLVQQAGGQLGNLVVSLNQQRGRPKLFFVCGIALYAPLAHNLQEHFDCFGIFVSEEEEFFNRHEEVSGMTVPQLASLYVRAIKKHSPDGPYVIAGVSFGGIMAFEIACQLEHSGGAVPGLVILDTILPEAMTRDWLATVQNILRTLQSKLKKLKRKASNLPSITAKTNFRDKKNARFWDAVRGRSTTTYLRGDQTSHIPSLVIRAGDKSNFPTFLIARDLGWGDKLKGPVTYVEAPGSHLGILKSKVTADLIATYIHGGFKPSTAVV